MEPLKAFDRWNDRLLAQWRERLHDRARAHAFARFLWRRFLDDRLFESAGALAERNACRTAAVHTLDLRGTLALGRIGGTAITLMAEAFDLLDSTPGTPDAALYLIDPDADLGTDLEARTVTVPLLVNDAFGSETDRRRTGRKLRLGISLNW